METLPEKLSAVAEGFCFRIELHPSCAFHET